MAVDSEVNLTRKMIKSFYLQALFSAGLSSHALVISNEVYNLANKTCISVDILLLLSADSLAIIYLDIYSVLVKWLIS